MLNPNIKAKVEFPRKRVVSKKNISIPFVSKICRSWTYYPGFRCLSESPIYTPLRKRKSPPYDGPYENCRTLPYPPFFKCYSNGLQLNISAQRHKINKQENKSNKIPNLVQSIKMKLKASGIVNIENKMSDSVAKAMIENANRANEKRKKNEMNKLNIYLKSKAPLKKTNSSVPAVTQKVKKDGLLLSGKTKINPVIQIKRKIPGKVLTLPTKINIKPGLGLKPNTAVKRLAVAPNANIAPSIGIKSKLLEKNKLKSYSSNIGSNLGYSPQIPATILFLPYKVGIPSGFPVQPVRPKKEALLPYKAGMLPGFHVKPENTGKDLMVPRKVGIMTGFPIKAGPLRKQIEVPNKAGFPSHFPVSLLSPKQLSILDKGYILRNKSISTPIQNPPVDFKTYVNQLLSQKKLKEAELFKKILRVIMASPKSQKYNEAGGDPWKYIFPALKWIQEYENVWKPKFITGKNMNRGNAKKVVKTNSLKKSAKKAIVPAVSHKNIHSNKDTEKVKEKDSLEEISNISSDNSTDEQEVHSLGFTTVNSTDMFKDYADSSRML